MQHTYEQVLLLGVGEEFYVAGSAMVTYHGKAGCLIALIGICMDIHESPVHLKDFSGIRDITSPSISLRRY